MLDQLVMI